MKKLKLAGIVLAGLVTFYANAALEEDFTAVDKRAEALFNSGDEEGAIKLWSGCIKYLGIYNPKVPASDKVAFHLARAYHQRSQLEPGNVDLKKKAVWYVSKAGLYGDEKVREAARALIKQFNTGETGDDYRRYVVQLAEDDVQKRCSEQRALEQEREKLNKAKVEWERKLKEAEAARTNAESEMRKAQNEADKAKREADQAKGEADQAKEDAERQMREAAAVAKQARDHLEAAKEEGRRESRDKIDSLEHENASLKYEKERDERRAGDDLKAANAKLARAQENWRTAKSELETAQAKIDLLEDVRKGAHYRMPVPAGVWRGLGTVTFSPINYFRCIPQANSLSEDGSVLATPFICAFDTLYVGVDVITGVLDTVTLGVFGNDYYTEGTTPWCWERTNDMSHLGSTFHQKRDL